MVFLWPASVSLLASVFFSSLWRWNNYSPSLLNALPPHHLLVLAYHHSRNKKRFISKQSMLCRLRDQPFLPKLASPSVQSSYDIKRSDTSYNDQFKGHTVSQRPRNFSVEHHEKHRREFALSHVDNPAEHYTTSAMEISSPERCAMLHGTKRPDPFPLEAAGVAAQRTSKFQFRTTNDEMFGFTSSATRRNSLVVANEHRRKDREEMRARRAQAKAGSLCFKDDIALDSIGIRGVVRNELTPQQNSETRKKATDHRCGGGAFLTTNQEKDAIIIAASAAQHAAVADGRSTFRQPPFSFPDQIQIDHSRAGLDDGVCTSYTSHTTPVAQFWKKSPHDRKVELSLPRALHCALPTISLAHRTPISTPMECSNCGSTLLARGSRTNKSPVGGCRAGHTSNNNNKYMQTTYQQEMGDPYRAQSSFF